jgi:hypothetical protein
MAPRFHGTAAQRQNLALTDALTVLAKSAVARLRVLLLRGCFTKAATWCR